MLPPANGLVLLHLLMNCNTVIDCVPFQYHLGPPSVRNTQRTPIPFWINLSDSGNNMNEVHRDNDGIERALQR